MKRLTDEDYKQLRLTRFKLINATMLAAAKFLKDRIKDVDSKPLNELAAFADDSFAEFRELYMQIVAAEFVRENPMAVGYVFATTTAFIAPIKELIKNLLMASLTGTSPTTFLDELITRVESGESMRMFIQHDEEEHAPAPSDDSASHAAAV